MFHGGTGEEGHSPVGAVLGQDGHLAAVDMMTGQQDGHLQDLLLERAVGIGLGAVDIRCHRASVPSGCRVFEQLEKSVVLF